MDFAKHATEYLIGMKWPDEEETRSIFITRRSNHGNFFKEGQWMVCYWMGSLNPWYLGKGGHWRYKYGFGYDSAEEAYEALRRAHSPKESWEISP